MAILIGTSAPVSIKSLQFIKLLLPVCPMVTAPSRCEVPCELKTKNKLLQYAGSASFPAWGFLIGEL